MRINIIPLLELLENHNENEVESLLSTFSCAKNLDVQNFLRANSIPYEKANNARTYLLVDDNSNILAFYSLALKTICLEEFDIPKGKKKKVKGYGNSSGDLFTGFLIGQLARNDNCIKEELSGEKILQFAILQLIKIQNSIGGRFITIDCVDELLGFYKSNGFSKIGKKAGLNIMVKILRTN